VRLTLTDIFDIPTAEIFEPDKFKFITSVVIDSRKVRKGSLFVAIKGERFDGHDFVEQAVENGATAVLISENKLKRFDNIDIPIICVRNTTEALGDVANIWRKKLNAKVISITGSNGKTSTKDYLTILLKQRYSVVSTSANNNNHIGVPLTIFEANEKTDILILEHGTNHFGEIKYTADIAEPDIALITNIGDSHLEYLVDRNGVLKEKSALYEAAVNNKGIIIVNNDDSLLRAAAKKMHVRKVSYGFRRNPDVKAEILKFDELGRANVTITDSRGKLNFTMPVLGAVNVQNILSAITAAKVVGLNKKEILNGIKEIKPPAGRLNLIFRKNFLIIDDTYNSNPNSVISAVEVLRKIKKYKKKILVLGDMFELGKEARTIHESLSEFVSKLKNAELLTIGKNMKYLSKKVENSLIARHFTRRDSLKKFLADKDYNGCVVLVKGSRGMHMEEFVKVLGEKE